MRSWTQLQIQVRSLVCARRYVWLYREQAIAKANSGLLVRKGAYDKS